MIIPVGVTTEIPILIVDKATLQGISEIELTSRISVNGSEFDEGPVPTEISHGWYTLPLIPAEAGYVIVEVFGEDEHSIWRDIIGVWEVEPTLPVRMRSIRTGLAT